MEAIVTEKRKRGFALLSPEERRLIASKGGLKAQALGKAHRWNKKTSKVAGKKGGLATHQESADDFDITEANERDSRIVELRVAGLKQKEIAAQMGCHVTTVHLTLKRYRKCNQEKYRDAASLSNSTVGGLGTGVSDSGSSVGGENLPGTSPLGE